MVERYKTRRKSMDSQLMSIEELSVKTTRLAYPLKVMECRLGRIKGPGFFPGSTGMIGGLKALVSRSVMVLGQDQDNQKGHDRSEREKGETYSKTWTNMTALFNAAGIDMGDCFFTNFIMGVRVESHRNTGPSPALAYPEFMEACCKLFIQQLEAQQPKVIICLGMIPYKLLSLVSSALRMRSVGIDTFKELDRRNMNVIPDVQFDALPDYRFIVVPICHPSYKLNGEGRFASSTNVKSEGGLLRAVREQYLNEPATAK